MSNFQQPFLLWRYYTDLMFHFEVEVMGCHESWVFLLGLRRHLGQSTLGSLQGTPNPAPNVQTRLTLASFGCRKNPSRLGRLWPSKEITKGKHTHAVLLRELAVLSSPKASGRPTGAPGAPRAPHRPWGAGAVAWRSGRRR